MFPANYNYAPLRYSGRSRPKPFNELETLFEQLFKPSTSESFFLKRGDGFPPIALFEDAQGFTVEVEVPGVTLENIDISVAGSELTIKGTRQKAAGNVRGYHRQERFGGQFTRVIKLAADIDEAKISASLKDGVLTIALPKGEAARPRRIEVRTN